LREGVVEINAAVIGVSSTRWTYLDEIEATEAKAAGIMRDHRYDILPVVSGQKVRKYFRTLRWNDYSSVCLKAITHKDVIPFRTHVRDVINGFASDPRKRFQNLQNQDKFSQDLLTMNLMISVSSRTLRRSGSSGEVTLNQEVRGSSP
jgi:hypothetical protein